MLPAASTMAGTCLTAGPTDVCKTPTPVGPVPMPYPNIAQMMLAQNFALTVTAVCAPAITIKSKIPTSNGDEAGVAGGVVSGQNMGPCSFPKGSSTVFVEGMPWVHLTSPTSQNGQNANTPAMVAAPSQSKVTVFP